MTVYLHESVNASAVESYVRKACANRNNVRALQIIKGDEVIVRLALSPYEPDMKSLLYSLSKSYTSVACGICMDDGLLTPETKMYELFSDKMPETVSDSLKEMTLSDLLSMQSGHEECVLYTMRWAEDSIKAFFEQPLKYESGKTFVYNTGATCICAAAVERVTGKKLTDFLYERMFSVMDIEKPRWAECRDGQTLGGTGLYLSSDDLVKFAIMLKNKGVYNGTRIVSEEYLALATAAHADNSNSGGGDWGAGYGYQFWMNERGGYRGDGAFGQACMIFPESDTAVILQSETADMNLGFTYIYELLDNLYGEGGSIESLEKCCKEMYKTEKNENGFNDDLSFEVGENVIGLKTVRVYGEKLLHLVLDTDYGKKELICGNGEFMLNHVMLKFLSPMIINLDPALGTLERLSIFAAYELVDGKIKITLRHADTPHVQRWVIDPEAGTLHIDLMVGLLTQTDFSITKLNIE